MKSGERRRSHITRCRRCVSRLETSARMSSPSRRGYGDREEEEEEERGDEDDRRWTSFMTPRQRQRQHDPLGGGPPLRSSSSWSLSSSLRVLSRTSSSAGARDGSTHGPMSHLQPCSRALRTMVRRFVAAYYRDLNVAPSRVEKYYTVRVGATSP